MRYSRYGPYALTIVLSLILIRLSSKNLNLYWGVADSRAARRVGSPGSPAN